MPCPFVRVSCARIVVVCAVVIFSSFQTMDQTAGQTNSAGGHPRDYIRSIRPLKSGGSITSVTSQGQKRSWVNQPESGVTRGPQARVASRETGFSQDFSRSSTSFYRQAQSRDSTSGSYPYPGGGTASAGGDRSRFANDQQAELRFERAAVRDRTTGALGNSDAGNPNLPGVGPNERSSAGATGGPNDRSTDGLNRRTPVAYSGPNYAQPSRNFAGYQGYQPGAVSANVANSVPALNTRAPAARVAQNCCVPCQPVVAQPRAYQPYAAAPQAGAVPNPGYLVPQIPQGQGYAFQPNIGVPQLGGSNRWWSSFLTGSGQYTPLLQFRNMPPGSYLGQGLIGQPTAYVDGQPLRNLLRYIAP